MKDLPAKLKPLNIRQERVARLIADGMLPIAACLKSGYSSKGGSLEANAHRIMANDGVAARIAELKAESQIENRRFARMSKDKKLQILEDIAKGKKSRSMDRIAAIKTHNEMTGDNEPTVSIVESGPKTLDMIRTRAAELTSAMARINVGLPG